MALCSDDKNRASKVECRAFKKHFADLSECIQSPTTLAGRLYSADLLSRDTRRTICSLESPAQQITELLDAVEGQIRLDPQNFYKFVDELEKDSPMQPLCDKLRSTCAQLKSTQPVSSVTLPPSTSAQQIREHDTMLPSPYVPSLKVPAITTVDLSDLPDGTLDIHHLAFLMVALTDIAYQWEHLGTQLGLKYGKLKAIERNMRGIPMDCTREMLAAWLQGSGGVCSKQALKTALQKCL